MAATDGGIKALLASYERDFLVRNSGEQVKISSIETSTVALYFSASWCLPCREFTLDLIEAYKELLSEGKSFEVVFVSCDQDEGAFNTSIEKMPWLAVPFSDSKGRKGLDDHFKVRDIPHLVILNAKTGEIYTEKGYDIMNEYGKEAYPFTPERMNELMELEKVAKDNQTIHSVLGTTTRDYLISNNGDKVPITDLEGKYVGLCFVQSGYRGVDEFNTVLTKFCAKLKEVGEEFEVIAVSFDDDEASFNKSFTSMPWLAIPFGDKMCKNLCRYFEIDDLPALVLIGPDGKTLNNNVADIIEEHGTEAWELFPFTGEKLEILADKAKAKAALQTLESLLVTGDLDFILGKDGAKVPVSELVGKTVLLYFSAKWCGPCQAFLPTLVKEYNKIKEENNDFEIIFISSDTDQKNYDDFYSGMPWLALPFGDERKEYLSKTFKIRGIPSLVAIGPNGKTVTTDAEILLMVHGADAFPFNDEKLEERKRKMDAMASGWPEKLKHPMHTEHDLLLTSREEFYCDGCNLLGKFYAYACTECNFDLHKRCALDEEKKGDEKGQDSAEAAPAEYVREGDVCRKA